MSTEHSAPRRFRLALVATTLALIALSGGLITASVIGGMRVSVSLPESRALVAEGDQSIVVTANEQLTKVAEKDVRITPAVPFTVSTTANRVTIGIGAALEYDTEYRFEVKGLTGTVASRPVDISRTIRTPRATIVLSRNNGDSASIVTVAPDVGDTDAGGTETELIRVPSVSDFAVADGVALVAMPTDRGSEIAAVDLLDGSEASDRIAVDGLVSQMDAEPSHALWGYRLTATTYTRDSSSDGVLFVSRDGSAAEPLTGLDGQPLQVTNWRFLPGKPALVALDTDGDLTLFDLRPDRDPVPLGSYASIESVGVDGASVIVSDDQGLLGYDLTTGTVSALDFDLDDDFFYPIDAIPLPLDEIRLYSVLDPTTHLFTQRVAFTTAGGESVTLDSTTLGGLVSTVRATANGRYLAVTSTDEESLEPRTTIVDLRDGSISARFDGGSGVWVR